MQCVPAGGGAVRNILLTISYDGRPFHGWQIQQNALSVQQVFQDALQKIIGQGFQLKGCSRTDTGVHANMYCISLKTTHMIPAERLKAALNRFLPMSIAVHRAQEVPLDFHARYSCVSKQYIYKIWNAQTRNPFLDGYALHYRYPLDVPLLHKAAQQYVGRHDFTSFCTADKRQKGDFTRNVHMFSVTRDGELVTMCVEADGFLYNMVRIMVGTLLRVAQGKFAPGDLKAILQAKDRKKAGPTAPACGLYLNKVCYKTPFGKDDENAG